MWACLVAFCCGHAAAQAPAPTETSYDELVRAAVEEFSAARFTSAHALFARAHALKPSARTLRGLALTEFELGRRARALRLLRRALMDVRHPLSDELRAEAEGLLQRVGGLVGRYRVIRQPASAELFVDGRRMAPLDELMLDVGTHRIDVRAGGYQAQSLALDVRGGEQTTLRFELRIAPEQANGARARTEPPTRPSGPAPAEAPATAASGLVTWGWIAAGAATLALGGAVLAWQLGEPAAERWNSPACLAGGRTRAENCASHLHAAESAQDWAYAGLIAGSALALGAALLWVTDAATERSHTSALGCGTLVHAWGAECSLRF